MKKMAFITLIGLCLMVVPLHAQFNLLHEFANTASNGRKPYGSLVLLGSTLYGMTHFGGSDDLGTIFKIQTDGSGFALLHEFTGSAADGGYPYGSLAISGSTLYGLTERGGTIFKIQTDGNDFALLHSFAAGTTDGAEPCGSLVISGSTLYGMTPYYGAHSKGVIFKIEDDGRDFSLLHSFAGGADDGAFPFGSLVLSGSTLFGMTNNGGENDYGTVFRIEATGTGFALLHKFAGHPGDGANPMGSLVLSGSTLYGMTYYGGANDYGTVFKIQADGSGFALLHSFASGTGDGASPYGEPVLSGPILYGLTLLGGSGYGTVFRLGTDSTGFSLLHSFVSGTDDGASPYGAPVLSGSILYGLTLLGGDNDQGVAFSYTLYNDLYIFDGHDFNGDGGSDVSVFRPSNNFWYIKGVGSTQWGTTGDKPVSGDYDGDGRTDVAVFRASTGKWYIRRSFNGATLSYLWGTIGDVPVPGDYDGDGKTDVAVWRPSTGMCHVKGTAGTNMKISWGLNGDIPVPGDYDGDGKADMAVFRAAAGKWYIKGSNGTNYTYKWGQGGDSAVPADYDGDGKDDPAIFRAAAGKWYIQGSMGTNYTYSWGQSGDAAAPGDYDKDGKADVAVFRQSSGKWYARSSFSGSTLVYSWGTNGDVPLVK
jgi:uncharacterized repeat protein (TIGR03803 family)